MSLTDAQFISNVIGCIEESVVVTTVSISFGSDEYRNETESTTTKTVTCYAQTLDTSHTLVKEGRFNEGDKIFWFKASDSSYILKGNKITQDSIIYEINEVVSYKELGDIKLIEARTKKI